MQSISTGTITSDCNVKLKFAKRVEGTCPLTHTQS